VLDDGVVPLHDLEVALYESHLEGYAGKLFARPVRNVRYSEKQVCVSAKERGGFTGNLSDLENHVNVFLREMAFLLRDGGRIDLGGLLEAKLVVGGWVESEYAPIDPARNQLRLSLSPLPDARKLAEGVRVINCGLAPVQNYIAQLIDTETGTVNTYVTKHGIFTLLGHWIKIVGDPALAGLFFVSPGSPGAHGAPGEPDLTVKVTSKLTINNPAKLIGVVPELAPGRDWYLEVRTFYCRNSKPLKVLRTIRSDFTVRPA
jgi:hypothetical protein